MGNKATEPLGEGFRLWAQFRKTSEVNYIFNYLNFTEYEANVVYTLCGGSRLCRQG